MALAWRDGVFACASGGREILLDLRTGRYSSLAPRAAKALSRARALGVVDPEDHRALEPLIRAGTLVLVPDELAELIRPLEPPDSQSPATASGPLRRSDFYLAVAVQLAARAGLRLLGFGALHRMLLSLIGRRPMLGVPEGDQIIRRIGRALDRSEVLFPRSDRCLARSVAFRFLALVRGVDVRLVIGVVGKPFAAHCWVERDGMVLNDDLETVAQFTPILAV